MMRRMQLAALGLWLTAPGALAQQQTFACTRLCWSPSKNTVTCSKKLREQVELTSYIYAVQHNTIAKGKPMTFFVDMKGSGQSCGSPVAAPASLSIVGYVNAQNVTGFTVGGVKVGDTIEITASGVAEDQKNIMFFPDPSEK
ncbi:MAG: hypothetical protein JOY67_17220 [Hyphomicrobiales bacterium]|nr:hypothetical protein [Hyphomicrobiales bacterium]